MTKEPAPCPLHGGGGDAWTSYCTCDPFKPLSEPPAAVQPDIAGSVVERNENSLWLEINRLSVALERSEALAEQQKARGDRYERDALRYRWLKADVRGMGGSIGSNTEGWWDGDSDVWDAAIDAALKAGVPR